MASAPADGDDHHFETFQALLPEVRTLVARHRPPDWSELSEILYDVTDEPLGPLAVLPLAACDAAGGDPRRAVPVAAAWQVLNHAVRILDDLQDQDRPDGLWATVGPSRAFNFSAALYSMSNVILAEASWPAEQFRAVSRIVAQAALRLAAGQDRDLLGATTTLDDYWRTITGKNASAFAMACAAGACCGSVDPVQIDACRRFGLHLGLALQIFDDVEGVWEPLGRGDLEDEKVTLPLLFGLSLEHPAKVELRGLVEDGRLAANAERIRQLLDAVRAREFAVWVALQERDAAVAVLASCPGEAGVRALTAYVTALFARIETVVQS